MILRGRFFYLLYYLRETERKRFRRFLKYAKKTSGHSAFRLFGDAVISVFKYNVSILDYFYFRFCEIRHDERIKWAGTGFMYEFQLKMNPLESRSLLSDKIKFLQFFKPFVKRWHHDLDELKKSRDILSGIIAAGNDRIVLKGSKGQIGSEVEVVKCSDFTADGLIEYMGKNGYDLVEEYIVQHPALMELSPSGLNTVRVITQVSGGSVDLVGCRLRISVNSPVDNMAAGNLAAPVDCATGVVTGPGVFSDITKPDMDIHPVTGKPITGFTVPMWDQTIALAREAAIFGSRNRSVGWDIAITAEGPELIEGNHNWCKLLWQLPVKQGLRSELVKYL